MIIRPVIECPKKWSSTNIGIEQKTEAIDHGAVNSSHFIPQINGMDDIEKIEMPEVTYHKEESDRRFELLQFIFADILPVVQTGIKTIWFTPWDNLIRLVSMEGIMMDLIMRPEFVDTLVSRYVDATVAWVTQQYLTADMVAGIVGLEMPLNALEAKDIVFISSGLITISAGMLWFFGTMLFYRQTTTEAYRESVDGIFKDMVTPIDHAIESDGDQDGTQYKNMSMISLIYGGALCLGFLIPNTFTDRLVFIWCGGVFVIIGTVLQLIYRKRFSE